MMRLYSYLMFCIVFVVSAGAVSGQTITAEREYVNFRSLLSGDSAEGKIRAAYFFRAKKNPHYLRSLGKELIRELDLNSLYRKSSAFDPYVKSQIAIAIGKIGESEGLFYLTDALERTGEIVAFERKQAVEKTKRENDFISSVKSNNENEVKIQRIAVEPTEPGPALYVKESALPYSPDAYWSVSDEFKGEISVRQDEERQAIRLKGYNYVNLTMDIIDAIGNIYANMGAGYNALSGDDGIFLVEFLNNELPAIRGSAAGALGRVATPRAMGALEGRLEKEKNDEAKLRICRAILNTKNSHRECYGILVEYLKNESDFLRYSSAVALKELSMGESMLALQRAHKLEEKEYIKQVLDEAIENADRDNHSPVSMY